MFFCGDVVGGMQMVVGSVQRVFVHWCSVSPDSKKNGTNTQPDNNQPDNTTNNNTPRPATRVTGSLLLVSFLVSINTSPLSASHAL